MEPGGGEWVSPVEHRVSLMQADCFHFLNYAIDLGHGGWDDPTLDKLLRYNLHYFDDLVAEGWRERGVWHRALLEDWIVKNPPAAGTGWEPYPTSLRIVNWIKWALAGNTLSESMVRSLATQARWLMRRIEWHLLGNHLYANAKALLFAGLWFEGAEAERWRRKGVAVLAVETDEQILADGGHFERSPMYHALALEDVLDLINISQCFADSLRDEERALMRHWQALVPRMEYWLACMSHPDGDLAFFNDAAFAIAPTLENLRRYAGLLGLPMAALPSAALNHLSDSGYVRLNAGAAALLIDAAPVGADYIPAHAHADTLSFELSLFGQRLFVNSGTSVYGTGAERHRQRGTPAHNTVTLAGHDSSDVWAGFRVGRRARPLDVRVAETDGAISVEAAHDGYRYLSGKPVHRRRWQLAAGAMLIEDEIDDPRYPGTARLFLHPDVVATIAGDCGEFVLKQGQRVAWQASGGAIAIEPATWHPEFGLSIANQCLVIALRDGVCTIALQWPDYDGQGAHEAVHAGWPGGEA